VFTATRRRIVVVIIVVGIVVVIVRILFARLLALFLAFLLFRLTLFLGDCSDQRRRFSLGVVEAGDDFGKTRLTRLHGVVLAQYGGDGIRVARERGEDLAEAFLDTLGDHDFAL